MDATMNSTPVKCPRSKMAAAADSNKHLSFELKPFFFYIYFSPFPFRNTIKPPGSSQDECFNRICIVNKDNPENTCLDPLCYRGS